MKAHHHPGRHLATTLKYGDIVLLAFTDPFEAARNPSLETCAAYQLVSDPHNRPHSIRYFNPTAKKHGVVDAIRFCVRRVHAVIPLILDEKEERFSIRPGDSAFKALEHPAWRAHFEVAGTGLPTLVWA